MTGGGAGPRPLFIDAFPRSGGTLLTAMFDARADTSLCYELYERDLERVVRDLTIEQAVSLVLTAIDPDDPEGSLATIEHAGLRRFARLGRRSGLEAGVLADAMKRFARGGGTWDTAAGRLDFIEGLMQQKAETAGVDIWGGKTRTDPKVLLHRHPSGRLVKSIRDGRDVLASQLHTGSFDPDPHQLGIEWGRSVDRFLDLVDDRGAAQAQAVPYERLVVTPEAVLTNTCRAIGLDFDERMTNFASERLSLFKNPHGQLSADQLRAGLQTSSVGRWRHDLTPGQLDAFLDAAAPVMRRAGYVI